MDRERKVAGARLQAPGEVYRPPPREACNVVNNSVVLDVTQGLGKVRRSGL